MLAVYTQRQYSPAEVVKAMSFLAALAFWLHSVVMGFPVLKIKGAPCTLCAQFGCRVHTFGTCAPGECTLFQSISIHYTGLHARTICWVLDI